MKEDAAKRSLTQNNMPELPEVETIKNFLLPQIKNQTIDHVEVIKEKQIHSDVNEFISKLKDQTFLTMSRIGKYLFFHLTNDLVIISHLRMEGKYYYLNNNKENPKHTKVIFHLKNGDRLIYDDSRGFGMLKLSTLDKYKYEKEIIKLGKEPFDVKDVEEIINKINPNASIKATLLDQTVISGIGNIYADEILYKTKLHPNTKNKNISKAKWEQIIKEAIIILNESIKANGSTIKSYHPSEDKSGEFQNKLHVYGKKNERCPICNSVFKKIVVASRGTTYCPLCQKLNIRLNVALTGPSGVGKSTVLKYIKDKGYDVYSADEIVKNLYKNATFAKYLGEKLGISFKNEVDKNVLKQYLSIDKNNKKKLNEAVHPCVKNEIEKVLKENEKMIFIEVPLLYEAHLENLFDVVIAITSNKQDELLKNREGDNYSTIKKINADNKFNTYKHYVDFIINNNSSLEDLYSQIDKIINKLK